MKFAMAGLLAGFCVSATAASSATSETAVTPEQAVEEMVVMEAALEAQEAPAEEIAMSKCSSDDSCGAKEEEKPCKQKEEKPCKEKPKTCSKSAAQKAME